MYHQYGSGRLVRNTNNNNNNSSRELEEDDDEINGDPSKLSTTRSYIEMMREDKESSSETAYRDLIHSKSANKNNYRRSSFNESTAAVPASDIAFGSRRFDPSTAYPADDYVMDCNGEVCVRVPPSRQPKKEEQEQEQEQEDELSRPSPVLVDDHKDDKPGNPRGMMMLMRSSSVAVSRAGEEEEAPAAKVSLMDLLMEEKGGTDGAEFFLRIFGGGDEEGEESEEEEEEEEEEREENGEEHDCGVCMVRHRGGAAAAPCGHTYCRLCSRELWVSKGNCPLCNGYVTEILDIF